MAAGRVALILDMDNEGNSAVAWSTDGLRLAGSQVRRVKVWDAAERTPESLRQAAADRARMWRFRAASAAEVEDNWFAADFHLSRLIAKEAQSANLYSRRGYARAALADADQGPWAAAVSDFNESLSQVPGNTRSGFLRALMFLKAGETGRYAALCGALVAGAKRSAEPLACHNVAWSCCLAPSTLDTRLPLELATRAAKAAPREWRYAKTLAAALYRAGRYAEAVTAFADAAKLNKAQQPEIADWLFLAMAHHRLRDTLSAHFYLHKASLWTQKSLRDRADDTTPLVPWETRLEIQLLHAEATALLTGGK